MALAHPAIAQCHYSVELVSQLGCPIGSPSTLSATEIGNDATIAGIGSPCGTLKQIAFRWRSDVGLQFLALGPGNGYSFARHVTDDGVIVGYMGTSSLGPLRGFVWKDGTVQTFSAPNPSHSVRAYCSTADGSVFGYIDASGNGLFPFWWRDGEFLDVGAADGEQYSFRGATMDSIVAGVAYLPDGMTELPVRWQDGAFEMIPLPPGYRRGGAERVN